MNIGAQGDGTLGREGLVVGEVLQCGLQQIVASMTVKRAQPYPMPGAFYPKQLSATQGCRAAPLGEASFESRFSEFGNLFKPPQRASERGLRA
ncbi:hypothetical protein D3C79_920220 [compost metagenome]